MQVRAVWTVPVGDSVRVIVERTCKLPVTVATVTELGDQLAVELEDEDTAGLVVHHDDVTISVH